MTRHVPFALAALLLGLADASACPFCSATGQSLTGEVAQSDFIVLGTMTNARRDPEGDFQKGTTDLVIETVVKPHEYLAGKKTLPIPRFIPADPKNPDAKFLVFCSLYSRPSDLAIAAVTSSLPMGNNQLVQVDAVRGDPVAPGSTIADYLKGAYTVRSKDTVTKLKYFFSFLDSSDILISTDAMNEFALADYPEVQKAAQHLNADKLRAWLRDPTTMVSKIGLYGLLLGHCGKPADAALLRQLLDAPDARFASGRDGLLAGYTLLNPKEGYAYILSAAKSADAEFQSRYAALKALRFFHDYRADVVSKDKVLVGIKAIVEQPDMADLPIDDLRKWKAWDQTDFVLSFADKPDHARIPITSRAILRFALCAPADKTAAKNYVERERKKDSERVKYVEQTLEDEVPAAKK